MNEPVVSSDMNNMHAFYGFHNPVKELSPKQLKDFLKFRIDFLDEELSEGRDAFDQRNPEEIVDSLIDLIVVAVGTLDLFEVDFAQAWDTVLKANMAKKVGIKKGRPNKFGFPDLTKPEGWIGPDHAGNHGLIKTAMEG